MTITLLALFGLPVAILVGLSLARLSLALTSGVVQTNGQLRLVAPTPTPQGRAERLQPPRLGHRPASLRPPLPDIQPQWDWTIH